MNSRVHQFVFIVIGLLGVINCTFSSPINDVREVFFKASYDYNAFLELKELLNENRLEGHVPINAYRAAFKVLTAKYTVNTFDKIRLVYTGLDELNELIKLNNNDLELRFLRFALEYHIPNVLFLSKRLKSDKLFILDNVSRIKLMDVT